MEQMGSLKLNSGIPVIDSHNCLQARKFSNLQHLQPAVFLPLPSGTRK